MGGCAALHLAFTFDDLFSKVRGHGAGFIDDAWLYPSTDLRNERDPVSIALKKDLRSLKVYLDCGSLDSFRFFEGCDILYKILQSKGVPSEYHLNSGEHNDAFWQAKSEKYLIFYAGK